LIDSEFRIQESEFRISPMDECARRVEEKLVLGGLEIFRKAKEIARMVSSIRITPSGANLSSQDSFTQTDLPSDSATPDS
jgi:hypothetical protein